MVNELSEEYQKLIQASPIVDDLVGCLGGKDVGDVPRRRKILTGGGGRGMAVDVGEMRRAGTPP